MSFHSPDALREMRFLAVGENVRVLLKPQFMAYPGFRWKRTVALMTFACCPRAKAASRSGVMCILPAIPGLLLCV